MYLSSSSSFCLFRFFRFCGPPMMVVSCLRIFFFLFCVNSSSVKKNEGSSVRFFGGAIFLEFRVVVIVVLVCVCFSSPLLRRVVAGEGEGVLAVESEVSVGVVGMKATEEDWDKGELARRGERGDRGRLREAASASGEDWGDGEYSGEAGC